MTSKPRPSWVEAREALRNHVEEPLVFVGERGADGVIDGKLPNGEEIGRASCRERV
jgi:hypothetical protein